MPRKDQNPIPRATPLAALRDWALANQSPLRLLAIVALSAFVAEFLVMLAFSSFLSLSALQRALVDGLLLVVLLTPMLYLFVLRPLADQIARRRRTEEALRRSENRFRTVADFAYDWEYWIEPGGTYVYNSPSCQRITGYAPRDFQADPHLLQKMTHPDDRAAVEAHFREERQDGETHSLDFRIITRSGEERWINHVCQQVHDEDGNWLGWRGSNRDITVRRRAEQARQHLLQRANRDQQRIQELLHALRLERDRLETIMESTHANLAYLDPDFDFMRVNSAYAQQSGYRKQDLIGRNHFDLFPHAENQAIFERVRDTGEPIAFRAKPFEFPDRPELGTTYWDWTLVPVQNQDGEAQGLVLSLLNVTEREQLMRQLEDQRAKLQAIIEHAPEGIIVTDEAGGIALVNPAACAMFDLPMPCTGPFESPGTFRLYRSDSAAIDWRELPLARSAVQGEVFEDVELIYTSPQGQHRDLLIDSVPIRDGGGEITGAVGLFRDITERKRTEEAVRRYAERVRVLHELDQVILSARSEAEIANRALPLLRELIRCPLACVELFDVDAGELRLLAVDADGESPLGEKRPIQPPWDRRLEGLTDGQACVAGDDQMFERLTAVSAARGEPIARWVSLPLRAGGQLIGALSLGAEGRGELTSDEMDVAHNVASQVAIGIHQAQLHKAVQRYAQQLESQVEARTAELRASEERFRAIFEYAAIGIALADMDGRLLVTNPAFQEIMGYSDQELQRMDYREITHPDDLAVSADLFRELVAGQRDHYTVEKRYVRKDGTVIWARLTASTVQGPEADLRYAVGMVEDITEWKRARTALIQAEKLNITGRLAASLAHEINNPLQTVIGCLGLAEETLEEGVEDELETYVSLAREELVRTAGIVSQLRDVGRPSEMPSGEPTDVNTLIDTVLELTRKKLENQHIRVTRRTPEGLPRPELSPDRVKQVFLNLVLNAIDVMPGGGELTVTTRYDQLSDELMVSFADSGPGIPDDMLPRVFDPFFSTKAEGTGLGLFVSQNIVQEHGGRIEVESEPGQGAAFTVHLPL